MVFLRFVAWPGCMDELKNTAELIQVCFPSHPWVSASGTACSLPPSELQSWELCSSRSVVEKTGGINEDLGVVSLSFIRLFCWILPWQ